MRLPILLLALALLAGCVAPDNGATPSNSTSSTTGAAAALPPPINDTKEVQGSAEPLTGDPTPIAPCSTPSAKCYRYAFQLNATARMTATLTWGIPASDFDLHLLKDGKAYKSSASSPPGTSEKLDEKLDPAKYELVVAAAGVSQDTFKIAASFAAA